MLALLPLAGRRQHLVDALALDDDRAVRVEHDDVALTDRRAADLDRLADRARDPLLRPPHADVARPDRETELAELLDVADGGIHEDRRHATALRLRREEISDERDGAGSGIVSTRTSPGCASATAACTMRLSFWLQRTVRAGPAAREPGTIWISGTSTTAARPAAS